MKKVFIHAYLAGNLGDDLFVDILCRRYPHVKFRILADESYKDTFRSLPNLKVYSPDDRYVKWWDNFIGKIKNTDRGFWKMLLKFSDAVVHIGGSSFVQHLDDYSAFVECDRTLRRLSKKMFLIGSNFGPYTDENYYRDYYRLFSTYDGVCLRDRHSYSLFEELANVKHAPDVVFNCRISHPEAETTRSVVISVINMKDRKGKYAINQYTDLYEETVLKIAKYYLRHSYKVIFVSFCKMQGDGEAIERIVSKIDDRTKVQEYFYSGDIHEVIRLFEQAEIVVGTRFHSIILGWLNNKKVFPIVYDEKTQNVLDDLNYKNYLTLDQLGAGVEKRLKNIETLDPQKVEELKEKAAGQFEALDAFLL